jgi:hypothetical protein
VLKQLGFGEYAAAVFVSLNRHGREADARRISEHSGVPITRVYSVLEQLAAAGLVKRLPGKVRFFKSVSPNDAVKLLRKTQMAQLDAQTKKIEQNCKSLQDMLAAVRRGGGQDVIINYYTKTEDYTEAFDEAEQVLLERGGIFRAIITVRPFFGFLKEEIRTNPLLSDYITLLPSRIEHKIPARWIFNLDALVPFVLSEFKGKKSKTMAALARMLLYYESHRKNLDYRSMPVSQNLVFLIMYDRIFMEFHDNTSVPVISALEIKNDQIVHDFSNWFDVLFRMSGKMNKEQAFRTFERELINKTEQYANIPQKRFEKFLATHDYLEL